MGRTEDLKELRKLLDEGLLSQEEYAERRAVLLAGLGGPPSIPVKEPTPYRPNKNPTLLAELMEGQEIGPDNHRFRLKRELGSGAMGRVWQAHDLAAEALEGGTHYKAIKVVAPELMNAKRALENLKREALRASKLKHPNIINVNGWQQGTDKWLFVEMEYLEGQDLDHLLYAEGEHGLPLERVFGLVQQMAQALDYAHQEHNLIHRDLKPGNIYITGTDRITLLDFGLAYQLRQSRSSVANAAKIDSSGTPIYMPPEAFVAGRPDFRQDVYALACLTYELLTGQPPYSEDAARNRPVTLYPPQPDEISQQTWEVFKQGLAFNQEERPVSAGEFYQKFYSTHQEEKCLLDVGSRIDSLRIKAEGGDVTAQCKLGEIYYYGSGVPHDSYEAVKLFRMAAEQGLDRAQRYLGQIYQYDNNVPCDTKEAVKWFTLAAKQGDDESQYKLGSLYSDGFSVPQNGEEAEKWFRLSCEKGNKLALIELGNLYLGGQGITQDYKEAAKLFHMAADHPSGQNKLGCMYRDGLGVLQDDLEAVKWFRLAAEPDVQIPSFVFEYSDDAKNNLGDMFRNGRGVLQDDKEAMKWYQLAAERHHAAQNNLGCMYRDGKGVPQDDGEAERWFRLAAEGRFHHSDKEVEGTRKAKYNLGCMYRDGRSVPQDDEEAEKWFCLAAAL